MAEPASARLPRPRKSGVVVPHRLTWPQRLAATLAYGLIRGLAATLRYKWHFPPSLLNQKSAPAILCVWHNRLALALLLYRDYARRRGRPFRLAALVSASKDGAVLARILEHFGAMPVRGSTSRRGPQALLELTTWAERGYDLAITPDGPRGPRYVVQEGIIALAQVTGLPVIPASYRLTGKVCTRSWDRFQIPLPFSRVVVSVGEPISLPPELSDSERAAFCQQLEDRLRALSPD